LLRSRSTQSEESIPCGKRETGDTFHNGREPETITSSFSIFVIAYAIWRSWLLRAGSVAASASVIHSVGLHINHLIQILSPQKPVKYNYQVKNCCPNEAFKVSFVYLNRCSTPRSKRMGVDCCSNDSLP
jgi:hypothetical protein